MMHPKTKDRGDEPGKPRLGLGRGLAALLSDPSVPTAPEDGRDHRIVAVEFLRPNPRNPRRHFEPGELSELSESIKAKGILQPIIVRAIPHVAGSFEIIAGERRWRAAQAAQVTDVPVIVIEADDREALAFAIIENVQRSDLNAIEEATAYERLAREFDYSQADLSGLIGKSRSHVANTLRLLKLPQAVLDLVGSGALSAGHARALLACADPIVIAARVVAEGLTVRDVEAIAQQEAKVTEGLANPERASPKSRRAERTPDVRALMAEFSAALKLPVSHHVRGDIQEIRIRYASAEDLASLRQRLAISDQP